MKETEAGANAIVRKWMWWSMGAGLIPFPVLDIASVGGLQLKMLKDLSKNYEIEFSRNRAKSILSALIGGVAPPTLAFSVVGSAIKAVPVMGPIFGSVTMPVFCGASTYAVGKVFIQHFESGGTFLDFDPESVREYFAREFEEGKKAASRKDDEKKKAS